MKPWTLDWRLKIPLALTAVILLTELVVTAALVTRALRDARTDLESSARNLVTVLGRSLREPLVRDHLWQAFEVISTPVATRTADNPLQRIVVLDAAGQVFVATDPRRIPVASVHTNASVPVSPTKTEPSVETARAALLGFPTTKSSRLTMPPALVQRNDAHPLSDTAFPTITDPSADTS